jgi:hypothetical protein
MLPVLNQTGGRGAQKKKGRINVSTRFDAIGGAGRFVVYRRILATFPVAVLERGAVLGKDMP